MITEHILESFKLGTIDYNVNIHDTMNNIEGGVEYGCQATFAGMIDIASGYRYDDKTRFGGRIIEGKFNEDTMNLTYYHEILHGMFDVNELAWNEIEIEALAKSFFQYMNQFIPKLKLHTMNEYIHLQDKDAYIIRLNAEAL